MKGHYRMVFSKKRIHGLIMAVLMVICALFLFGCENEGTPLDTAPKAPEKLSASDAMKPDGFKIVRPEDSDKAITSSAVKLRDSINETVTGASILIETDWVNRGEKIPTDTSEIVVGETNRYEHELLRRDDKLIVRHGNRIYITGGSDEAVISAVDFFIENYVSSDGILFPDSMTYKEAGKYSAGDLRFGNESIKELLVYTGNTTAEQTESYRNRLIPIFEEATGLTAKIVKESSEANIIFDSSDKIPEGSWGYSAEDGKLTLTGRTTAENRKLFSYMASLLGSADGKLEFVGIHSEKQMTEEEFRMTKQLVIYPEFPEKIHRDYRYEVSVTQGTKTEKLPVYNHTMESTVSRGYEGADDTRSFSLFAFSGEEVRVDIKVKEDFTSYSVMPSAKNFKSEYRDGVISVYLEKPDYFLIRLDDRDNTILSVFADYPEFTDELDFDDPNMIVIDGWYETEDGVFEVKDKYQTVYIAPGAVLNARVDLNGEGSKLIGRGAILDPFEDIYSYDVSTSGANGRGRYLLNMIGTNSVVDGPILLDARSFNITISGKNSVVRNTKVMSTMITSDGISVFGGDDALIEHCFVYCGDNAAVFGPKNVTYRDMTLGTTCAAIFPQANNKNARLEDIHVFRADDGVINHLYNGNKENLTADVKIKNIDSVDCTYAPWFFLGRNMGEGEKKFVFENVSLGNPETQRSWTMLRFENGSWVLKSDNYDMTLKNFAVNGKVIESLDGIQLSREGEPKHPGNKYSYETSADFVPVTRHSEKVDYNAENKIFIGKWQVFFEYPVIADDKEVYLPADQIRYELRTDKSGTTVEKNGVKYITASELLKSGMAKAVDVKDGAVIITPNDPTGNLFLEDQGVLSKFTEAASYQLHLVTSEEDGDIVYTVMNYANSLGSGIDRVITEEVRKYGTGEYVLKFKVKAPVEGKLKAGIYLKSRTVNDETFNVGTEWKEITLIANVIESHVMAEKINVTVKGAEEPLESFSMKDFSLTKTN